MSEGDMATPSTHRAAPLVEAADALATHTRTRTPGGPPEWGLFYLEGSDLLHHMPLPVPPATWETGTPEAVLTSFRAALGQPSVLGSILREHSPEQVWATYLVIECPPRDTTPGRTRRSPGPNPALWRPHPYTLHTVVDLTGYGRQVSTDYYGNRYTNQGNATALDPAAPVDVLVDLLHSITGTSVGPA